MSLLRRIEGARFCTAMTRRAILALNKALYKKMSYDPATDFAFVGMLGVIANVLLVNPKTIKASSVSELIDYLRQNPEKVAAAISAKDWK